MANKRVGIHGTDEETGRATKAKKEKTPCPISKDEFVAKAKPIKMRLQMCDEKGDVLSEQVVVAFPKVFSTGSYGWHANEKPTIDVAGTPLKCTLNGMVIVIGSKPDEAE